MTPRQWVAVAVFGVAVFLPKLGGMIPSLPVEPRSDTSVWVGILDGMADYIEADGKSNDPFLKTVSDIMQYRDAVMLAPYRGIGGGDEVAAVIAPKLGEISGYQLDAETRSKVVSAFRDAAKEIR